jgi:hypothetical protein
VLGISLTDAFLAPYLFATELKSSSSESAKITDNQQTPPPTKKNRSISAAFGTVILAVTLIAIQQCFAVATSQGWNEMTNLVRIDRGPTWPLPWISLCLPLFSHSYCHLSTKVVRHLWSAPCPCLDYYSGSFEGRRTIQAKSNHIAYCT